MFAKIQPSNVDKKIKEDQENIHLCNYMDVYNHEYIDNNINFMKATASDSQIIKFTLRKGDIIITKDSETPLDIAVPAFVPQDLPGIICGYHLAIIRPKNEVTLEEYLFRAFQSKAISNQYSSFANGLTRYGIKVYFIGNALFPIPPLNEQKSIITFLKVKTSEIDALIVDKQKMADRLQEYRKALISEAMTMGRDSNVEMKESGIEWIGKIPEHWKISKIKYIINKFVTGGTPSTKIDLNYTDDHDGIPWVKISDITSQKIIKSTKKKITKLGQLEKGLKMVPRGTLIYSIFASLGKLSELGIDATFNQAIVALFHNEKKILKDFLKYYLKHCEQYINYLASTNTQENLNLTKVKNINIILPLINEQELIVDYLNEIIFTLDKMSSNLYKQIEELKNYRQALISEAITGKIDVRNHN